MEEIWKDIPGYEGYYQVSNMGRVKRILFKNGNYSFSKEKVLKNFILHGYEKVQLNRDGKGIQFSVHRLVAQVFIANPENNPQVNHIDGNKLNNNITNLEWVAASGNIRHAYRAGLNKGLKGKLGTLHHTSKQVLQFDLNGNEIKKFGSTKEVNRVLGFDSSGIAKCCRGITHTAYGYIWRYVND